MLGNFEIKRPDLNQSAKVLSFSDYSAITDIFLCLPNFQFNSLIDFETESVWLAALGNKNMFPIHHIIDVQNQSEDTVIAESRFNFRHVIKPGKYRFAFSINVDIDYFIRLKKYEGQNLKAYFADINGNLFGIQIGNTVKSFDLDSIIIKKINIGDPNLPSLVNILIDFHNPIQIESGYVIKPDFEPSDLINIEVKLDAKLDNITFSSNFDNWIGGLPVGFETNVDPSYFINDNNRVKFTHYDNVHISPRLSKPFYNLPNGTYKVSFDVIELTSGQLGVASVDHIGHGLFLTEVTSIGHYEDTFTISGSPANWFIDIDVDTIDVGEHITIDNFLIENTGLSASTIIFTVIDNCNNPVTGLLIADFDITDEISGLITLSNFVELGSGQYSAHVDKTLYKGEIQMISSFYHANMDYDFGGAIIVIPQYNPSQYNNTQYKVS